MIQSPTTRSGTRTNQCLIGFKFRRNHFLRHVPSVVKTPFELWINLPVHVDDGRILDPTVRPKESPVGDAVDYESLISPVIVRIGVHDDTNVVRLELEFVQFCVQVPHHGFGLRTL